MLTTDATKVENTIIIGINALRDGLCALLVTTLEKSRNNRGLEEPQSMELMLTSHTNCGRQNTIQWARNTKIWMVSYLYYVYGLPWWPWAEWWPYNRCPPTRWHLCLWVSGSKISSLGSDTPQAHIRGWTKGLARLSLARKVTRNIKCKTKQETTLMFVASYHGIETTLISTVKKDAIALEIYNRSINI